MKQVRMISFVTLLMFLGWSGRGFAGQMLQASATGFAEPPVLDGKLTAGQQAWLNLRPVSANLLTAVRTDVNAIIETAPTKQLVVSGEDSRKRLVLTNLQYPIHLKILKLDMVQSDASEKEAPQAGARGI